MKGYKVTAKFGSDTVKFDLPIGVKQETLADALHSAREIAYDTFEIRRPIMYPETVLVTITEYYED